jgi:RNA polymerase sigma factor (sigma-70 family)
MPPPPAELFASRVFLGPALRAQPDRRLVDLVRDGYDTAFEEIVRRYRKQLDRFAAGIVGGRAEDVTQDAFSKALLALRGSEAEIELRPWLYRIVRNTALNDLRDRAPAAAELSELLPGGRSAAAEAETREELRDLMERLGALPEPQRAALVMRELEGLSHEEIAAALGVSGGAARQAIYRARAALREGLGFLMPLPVFRMLATHGPEMVKAGAATVLIAGTVGAGVAIEHHHSKSPGPEAAEAAQLVAGKRHGTRSNGTSGQSSRLSGTDDHGRAGGNGHGDHSSGSGEGDRGGSLSGGTRSDSRGGSGPSSGSHSGEGSSPSGDGSHHSAPNGSDDSGSGSGDRHGSSSDGDGSHAGSGSDDGSGSSGGSGSDDSLTSGDGGSSGPGSGEVESDPSREPTLSENSGGDGSNGDSGSGDSSSSGDGGGDLSSSSTTTEMDVSP